MENLFTKFVVKLSVEDINRNQPFSLVNRQSLALGPLEIPSGKINSCFTIEEITGVNLNELKTVVFRPYALAMHEVGKTNKYN